MLYSSFILRSVAYPASQTKMQLRSSKRPSLPSSPSLKRKRPSDEDEQSDTSPMSPTNPEESVISPTMHKSARKGALEESDAFTKWQSAIRRSALDMDQTSDTESDGKIEDADACEKVLANYTPVSWHATPATPLSQDELDMLEFFLS